MFTIELGDLMSALYEEFLSFYKDEELAAVATAATINEILAEQAWRACHAELDYAA